MDDRTRRLRIRLLIAAHFGVGSVLALITLSFRAHTWPLIVEIGYAGFFASEVLLLGIWTGLGSNRWWMRLCGMLFGIAWLCLVFLAGINPEDFLRELPEIMLVIFVCTFGVSGSFVLGRKTIASIESRAEWPQQSISKDLQFNVKSLLWLTALIGVLLTTGGTVRRWGGDSLGVFVLALVFALVAVLEAWLVTWAGLGCHNWVRVPFTLSAVALIGLLIPYCFGSTTSSVVVWPSLSLVTAVWTLASLYVIRSCGYRLVRLRIGSSELAA